MPFYHGLRNAHLEGFSPVGSTDKRKELSTVEVEHFPLPIKMIDIWNAWFSYNREGETYDFSVRVRTYMSVTTGGTMALVDKPITQITEADLQQLIADARAEDKTIDYKEEMHGGNDEGRREFLYDITSFANTEGGHVIFGMKEDAGLPSKLVGLGQIDADKIILGLEQSLRTGVQPPLTVESIAVPLAAGGVAIVMRIPKSWNPPHQVTFRNASKFYARASAGKYQLDVNDLRSVFSLSSTIADRMRDFRADRVAKIVSDNGPVPQLGGGALMLHVLPLSAFSASPPSFQISKAEPADFPTVDDRNPLRSEMTFDGLLMTSNVKAPPEAQRAYVMVGRTGTVEAVHSSIARTDPSTEQSFLVLDWLEPRIIQYARVYTQSLAKLGVEPPIAVMVGLSGVKGMRFIAQVPQGTVALCDLRSVIVARDQFNPIETILDTIPRTDQEAAQMLRPTLDHIANAFGLPESPSFDSTGANNRRLF